MNIYEIIHGGHMFMLFLPQIRPLCRKVLPRVLARFKVLT